MHGQPDHIKRGGHLKQRKVYICMENQGYGERLAKYIAEQHNPCMEVELLTEIKDKTEFDRQDFVVSDKEKILAGLNCQKVQMMKQAADGERKIFMYQSRADIYRRLLHIIGSEPMESGSQGEKAGPKIICVFSPEGGDAKTLLALGRAVERAVGESVLYISLCGFPTFFQEEIRVDPELGREGVSELLLSESSSIFCEKLEKLAFALGNISMIAPAGHYKDLLDFSREEVQKFMQHLKEQALFDVVMIEMGQLFEYTFDLLDQADEVIIPAETGFFAAVKRHVLHEYCLMEGQEALWNRMKFEEVSAPVKTDMEAVRELLLEKGGT